ncbi:MAG: thioredoxin family protein, partial [Pseudomonadales bacterium]
MLDQAILQQLKQHFTQLKQPVALTLNLDASKKSAELQQMVEQLSELSPQLSTQLVTSERERAPSLALSNPGNPARIRFNGVPSGHEFSSLVLAILQVGGRAPNVEQAQLEAIATLASAEQPLHFTSYISLSCQTCPAVVQALNVLAQQHPHIQHNMVDGSVFSEEVAEKNILAVPSVYLNGELFSQGAIKLQGIIDKLDSKSGEKRSAELSAREPYDVIVVGGGPAGASAAIYSARKGLRTAVVAERFGGQVMDTLGIENFISVEKTEGPKLVASLEQHVKSYDVDIIDQQRVSTLNAVENSASEYAELALE